MSETSSSAVSNLQSYFYRQSILFTSADKCMFSEGIANRKTKDLDKKQEDGDKSQTQGAYVTD